jgi:hypothetical protein
MVCSKARREAIASSNNRAQPHLGLNATHFLLAPVENNRPTGWYSAKQTQITAVR